MLSGAANDTQAASSIAKLEELRFSLSYHTTSSNKESKDYQLAPNPSSFLLEALFQARRDHRTNGTTAVTHLIDDLWGAMVNNDQYYSGASWEYVKPDDSPGLGFYTSLSHLWGAAPTYILSEYLLGVEPVSPGYKSFVVRLMIGFLNLPAMSGRVPTPYGPIEVAWKILGKDVMVDIVVPEGAAGVLQIPSELIFRDGCDTQHRVHSLTSGSFSIALLFTS
jgi:hypothetical protein